MPTKDSAICIRAVDYSETSQVVTFFARATGKFTAIAKGSKRPKSAFDGPIEIFSLGRIVFFDSNKEKLATLTEFQQKPPFVNLSGNLFALNCALFAIELLNNLTEDYDPHPQLFDSLLQFLQNLSESQATSCDSREPLSLLILFQLVLLKEVGLTPIFNYCVNCKTKYEHRVSSIEHQVYFSSSANGLICHDCEASFPDRIRVTTSAAKCLANLKLLTEADEKTTAQIEKLLISHFTQTLGRRLKLAKHILDSL
jgi:DNA repair protein RecO (recombination protein O)